MNCTEGWLLHWIVSKSNYELRRLIQRLQTWANVGQCIVLARWILQWRMQQHVGNELDHHRRQRSSAQWRLTCPSTAGTLLVLGGSPPEPWWFQLNSDLRRRLRRRRWWRPTPVSIAWFRNLAPRSTSVPSKLGNWICYALHPVTSSIQRLTNAVS